MTPSLIAKAWLNEEEWWVFSLNWIYGTLRLINELCRLRRRGCRLHFSYSSTCSQAYVRYSRNLIVLPPSKLPSVCKLWAGLGSSLAHSLITTQKRNTLWQLAFNWNGKIAHICTDPPLGARNANKLMPHLIKEENKVRWPSLVIVWGVIFA